MPPRKSRPGPPRGNTETVENYLKAIYRLAGESPAGEAGMSAVAALAGVTVGTASTMVKRLAAAKLVRYERFGGVKLTTRGEKAAVDVLRRHRLIETFLVRTLKLDWSVVHEEAERLEHAVSPVVLEALDEFLGRPSVDPHGDPIPDGSGRVAAAALTPLAGLGVGERGRVARVLDQSEAALRFLQESGLTVGAVVEVRAVEPGAGTVTVASLGKTSLDKISLGKPSVGRTSLGEAGLGSVAVSMSVQAAGRVLVEPERL